MDNPRRKPAEFRHLFVMGQLCQQLFVYVAAGGYMSGKKIIHICSTTLTACAKSPSDATVPAWLKLRDASYRFNLEDTRKGAGNQMPFSPSIYRHKACQKRTCPVSGGSGNWLEN